MASRLRLLVRRAVRSLAAVNPEFLEDAPREPLRLPGLSLSGSESRIALDHRPFTLALRSAPRRAGWLRKSPLR